MKTFPLLFFILSSAVLAYDKNQKSDSSLSLTSPVHSVYPAIVRIAVVSEKGSGGRMMKSRATGSGVIIDQSGLVVTNHHVAGKATRISCRLHDGEEVMADLLGADPMTDLAILRLRVGERSSKALPLTVAKFGNSDQVRVGDTCFAMGSPAGLSQSVTRGIISNVAMMSPNIGSFRLDGESVGELVRWLGHDAVIYPGNSGGPLVNEKGEIIGINEVGIGSLGGAIPANLAQSVAIELEENGYISRCWTGLECQPMLDPKRRGILVGGVIQDSPADLAGFAPGDIITRYDGHPVHASIPEDLPPFNQLAYGMVPGKRFKVVGIRDGKKMVWSTTSAPREPAFAKEKEVKTWGLTVRDFTLMSSLEARRSDKEGAQVHSVNRGGPSASAKPRLYPGDVIVKVGDRRIRSVKDLLQITHEITRGKSEPTPTLITLERDLAHLLTVVSIGPEAEENQPLQAWKPWLGLSTQVLTKDLSQALELPRTTKGIRVIQVFPETPAEDAGLQAGDLLFRIDGQIIMAYRSEDAEVFGNMVKEYKTDATIRLTGLRSGSPLDLNVTLDKRPPPANELPKYEDETFEFTVRELSFGDRILARLEKEQYGLLVDNVESAGWAALAGLMQGDLLLQIEGNAINQVDAFEEQMNDINRKKPKQIVFFVRRGIHTLFLKLEPDWDNE